jgi:hypothetical protein
MLLFVRLLLLLFLLQICKLLFSYNKFTILLFLTILLPSLVVNCQRLAISSPVFLTASYSTLAWIFARCNCTRERLVLLTTIIVIIPAGESRGVQLKVRFAVIGRLGLTRANLTWVQTVSSHYTTAQQLSSSCRLRYYHHIRQDLS